MLISQRYLEEFGASSYGNHDMLVSIKAESRDRRHEIGCSLLSLVMIRKLTFLLFILSENEFFEGPVSLPKQVLSMNWKKSVWKTFCKILSYHDSIFGAWT